MIAMFTGAVLALGLGASGCGAPQAADENNQDPAQNDAGQNAVPAAVPANQPGNNVGVPANNGAVPAQQIPVLNPTPGVVIGNWRVTKRIVGDAQVAPFDFTGEYGVTVGGSYVGLKDGDAVVEDWVIAAEGDQLKLTGPAGSTFGQPTADGAAFHWEGADPRVTAWGVQNFLLIDIECHLAPNGELYGGITSTLYVANGLGVMSPIPTTESSTFRAARTG